MTYRGTYKNGVIVFDAAPPLKEGQRVRVKAVSRRRSGPRRGSAEAILPHAGTFVGEPGEMGDLLAQLRSVKRAEVAAERARLGLPPEPPPGSRTHGPQDGRP